MLQRGLGRRRAASGGAGSSSVGMGAAAGVVSSRMRLTLVEAASGEEQLVEARWVINSAGVMY